MSFNFLFVVFYATLPQYMFILAVPNFPKTISRGTQLHREPCYGDNTFLKTVSCLANDQEYPQTDPSILSICLYLFKYSKCLKATVGAHIC